MKFLYSKFFLCCFFLIYYLCISVKTSIFGKSFFHSTEQVEAEMNKMISDKKCAGNIVAKTISNLFSNGKDYEENYGLLKYYDISEKSGIFKRRNKNKKNIFILSGEHPRELIAVETVLNFINLLCYDKTISHLLTNYNFRIIVNANPYGRQRVEKGEYCIRSNMNNVDLNRNWDYFWNKDIELNEEFPGKKPFSEVETNFVLQSLKEFKAYVFLSVHSGVYGLFFPYAYLPKEAIWNGRKMKSVLQKIKSNYCSNCMLGSPAQLIGYKSSGTSLDYAYEKLKIPFSFVWEIYTNEVRLKEMNVALNGKPYPRFLQITRNKRAKRFESFKNMILSNNYTDKRTFTDSQNRFCFALYNPLDKQKYDFIIKNWTDAMNTLLVEIGR